jgi:hypothetical protein
VIHHCQRGKLEQIDRNGPDVKSLSFQVSGHPFRSPPETRSEPHYTLFWLSEEDEAAGIKSRVGYWCPRATDLIRTRCIAIAYLSPEHSQSSTVASLSSFYATGQWLGYTTQTSHLSYPRSHIPGRTASQHA